MFLKVFGVPVLDLDLVSGVVEEFEFGLPEVSLNLDVVMKVLVEEVSLGYMLGTSDRGRGPLVLW